MRALLVAVIGTIVACGALMVSCEQRSASPGHGGPLTVQLNWLHDPTFVGHYVVEEESGMDVEIAEGGPNIAPLSVLRGGRADLAIVGADIFLKQLADEGAPVGKSEFVCIFVEFQRNPVGWVLHPDAARSLGLPLADEGEGRISSLIVPLVNRGELKVGDKRGTETTAVWLQWKAAVGIDSAISVLPVGFDPNVVLSAPRMLYPVYLNEQPFKLSAAIGTEVLVIDPADDGVSLYGNVVVARREFVESNPDLIRAYQESLRETWDRVRANPDEYVPIVASRYKSASEPTIAKQVAKTLEMVFFNTQTPGTMDVSEEGRWNATKEALTMAGSIPESLSWSQVTGALFPPE